MAPPILRPRGSLLGIVSSVMIVCVVFVAGMFPPSPSTTDLVAIEAVEAGNANSNLFGGWLGAPAPTQLIGELDRISLSLGIFMVRILGGAEGSYRVWSEVWMWIRFMIY